MVSFKIVAHAGVQFDSLRMQSISGLARAINSSDEFAVFAEFW